MKLTLVVPKVLSFSQTKYPELKYTVPYRGPYILLFRGVDYIWEFLNFQVTDEADLLCYIVMNDY